jgi:hypothetical protein
MKKFILAILLLFSITASAQVDLSKWKFVTNQVDGRVYAIENITAIYGSDSGTVRIPIHFDYSILIVDTVSYKDTLTVDATSVTYEFGSQYSNVKLIGMSDTAIAGGDTLRAYNIGYRGDTTDIYFLDSANNRILYVVSSGDCKYKEYRLDILCPEYVMFKFNDSPIYTTKWYLIPKAYKK